MNESQAEPSKKLPKPPTPPKPMTLARRLERFGGGVIGLLIAAAAASRALDTGSWWEYGYTLLALVVSIKLITTGFRRQH